MTESVERGSVLGHPAHPNRLRGRVFTASIVTVKKVEWAVGTFQPYKSPDILRASIALGHVPIAWRGSRVVFLPNTAAKDFKPLNLTSLILKVLERLVETCIRDMVLTSKPLHRGQHAFQQGCSVDTKLHEAVNRI